MPSNSSPTHFQGQYRIASARLPGWDYSAAAYYFVTIVTAQREHFFGAVVNAAMALSPIGECADAEWAKSAVLRPNIALDEYIVMPNHVHGIVIIKTVDGMIPPVRRDAPQRVSTGRKNEFGPLLSGSLQSVINGFKGAVTRWGRNHGCPDFGWQARFHDHIIRDEAALNRIRAYIRNNPAQWARDHDTQVGVWL